VTRLKRKLVSVLSEIVLILAHPMELLGDVGYMESCFFLFEDSVSVDAR
jgi:hypothetical protein